jgi:hypothetical protein
VTFVARYLDYLPNPKVINKQEFENLVAAGFHVVLNWEGTGRDLVRGYSGGVSDAREADRQVAIIGAHGCPVYFSPADYDVPPGDQGMLDAYLDGCAAVLGHSRVGCYGGYWPLSRAFTAGKMTWGWQTYAWSGTNLDNRAHLYQYHNSARLGPAEVDYDKSLKPDCGWWPRPVPVPHAGPVIAPPPPPSPAPPHVTGAPYRHEADGTQSLAQLAAARGTSAEHLWALMVQGATVHDRGVMEKLRLPAGWVWYSSNP